MVGREWIVSVEKGKGIPQLDLLLRTLTALNLGVQVSSLPKKSTRRHPHVMKSQLIVLYQRKEVAELQYDRQR